MKLKSVKLVILLVAILVLGCSPKSSYKVLSIFFDGVPDSLQMAKSNKTDTISRSDSLANLANQVLMQGPHYYQHTPYLKQECDKCHNKASRGSLLEEQPGLCYKCHTDFKQKFKFLHGPVGSGYCTSCHAHHLSEIPKLLKRKGQGLCLYCHEKEQVMKVGAHSGIGVRDCMECHDPHGGSTRYVLK